MFRGLAVTVTMLAVLATGAAGQHTVGVSAVVVDGIDPSPLDVRVQSAAGGGLVLTVPVAGTAREGGLAGPVVEQLWLVRALPDTADAVGHAGRAHPAGSPELVDPANNGEVAVRVEAGTVTEGLILIRVIASNS